MTIRKSTILLLAFFMLMGVFMPAMSTITAYADTISRHSYVLGNDPNVIIKGGVMHNDGFSANSGGIYKNAFSSDANSPEETVETLPDGVINTEYAQAFAELKDGESDKCELAKGELPVGMTIEAEYDETGKNGKWLIKGKTETHGLYTFDVKLYSEANPGVEKSFSIKVLDIVLDNATINCDYMEDLATFENGDNEHKITSGALPKGLHIASEADESGSGDFFVVGVPEEIGVFYFDVEIGKDAKLIMAKLTVEYAKLPDKEFCSLYEDFETGAEGFDLTKGFEIKEDEFAYEGGKYAFTNTESELTSYAFSSRKTGVELTWFDTGAAEYSVYLVKADAAEEPTLLGDFTATEFWMPHTVALSAPGENAKLVFKTTTKAELSLDMITITKGYDDTKLLESACVGIAYNVEIANLPAPFNPNVLGKLPAGLKLTKKQSSTATTYKLQGTPTEAGSFTFFVEYQRSEDSVFTTIKYVLTVEARQQGDVNGDGDVNTGDAVIVLKHAANIRLLDADQIPYADMNNDSNVNTGDAVQILKYAAGMIS